MTALVSGEPASARVLDPIDRIAEVLFGLIMVLTFTGSLSIADSGRDDVRAMLIGALGCNLAWGVIDALLYLMGGLAERGRGLKALRLARQTADPHEAQRLIADALPPAIASILEPPELDTMRQRLLRLPEPPASASLTDDDLRGALGVFFLVFLCILPVGLPFMFMQRLAPAMRVSNGIAIVMLFVCGWTFGTLTGRPRWLVGLAMVVIGALLVGMTMALGG